MVVGVFQFAPKPKAIEENLTRIIRRLTDIKADLVVLPELCLTGYMFSSREEVCKYAQKVPDGPVLSVLLDFCSRRNMNLVLGIPELAENRVFNSAILLTATGNIHLYRKVHLFGDEKELFDPGDLPFPVFQIDGVKIGMLVCFDYFFPEGARSLALRGAQIVCHPANLILKYAQTMTITRSLENRVFWLLANRIGTEELNGKQLSFTGESQIVAPDGSLLVRAQPDVEELLLVDINPLQALDKNVTPKNDIIANRRPELYYR
ncbi:MAG: nitrilase-related carbon-nitrogen hydrolase [candidate division WOR-3 bacterium]